MILRVKYSENGYVNHYYKRVACNDQFLVTFQQNTENYLYVLCDCPIF